MCDWNHFTMLVREPEIRKVGNDACVNVNGIKYQLSPELAGTTVTLLWGLFDKELRVSYKDEHYGPFYPAGEPIPFGSYKAFKKSSKEKQVDQIELLAKAISIPRSVLTNGDITTQELIKAAALSQEKQACVPFAIENPFEQTKFKNVIEAKTTIARWLGYPLGRLLPQQLEQINSIVVEDLDKKLVMIQIKRLFKIEIVGLQEETNGY